MSEQERNFIGMIAAAVNEKTFVPKQPDYALIMQLAQRHGMLNLLSDGVFWIPRELHPTREQKAFLKKATYLSAVKEELQSSELSVLSVAFVHGGISCVLLKGAVVKHLYDRADQRHMSDTDLLIDPTQAEAVRRCLEELGYRTDRYDNGSTDIYTSPSGLRYEVHRSVEEEGFHEPARRFLKKLLSYAVSDETKGGLLRLPYEEHYAYMLCHFAKHLLYGGIGVRQVMDLHLCRQKWEMSEEKLSALLNELELTAFAATVERLAMHWFGGGPTDPAIEELGEYIMDSGIFGKEEHKTVDRMLRQKKSRGKLSYVFCRLFPDYKTMCFYYPVLKKWEILLPAMWVWRGFYALIWRRDKLKKEVNIVNETDDIMLQERATFYQRCGLNVYPEQ